MFKFYQTALFVGSPLIKLYLNKRKKKGKEDPERFPERFGHPSIQRPEGKLVWFHGASIGEAVSILSLIDLVLREFPECHVLVTTGTVTSARLLKHRLPARAFHQYVPVDKLNSVKRFLKHWKPDLALWVESELWPNLINEAAKQGIKMMLINGRISDSSFRMWGYLKNFSRSILKNFVLCLAQSAEDAKRLKELGAINVKFLGNLKYDSESLSADPKKYAELVKAVGRRRVWLAASTHKGEEKAVAEIHKYLERIYPDLLTIIVPRHPVRGVEIEEEAKTYGSKTRLRSRGELPDQQAGIYIADTVGELGIFYRLSPIVFVGGSLVRHGGQNPLEPARLDCAIISGIYHKNFREIYQEMEAEDAVIIVDSERTLQDAVERLMESSEIRMQYTENARKFTDDRSGVALSYLEEIKPYLQVPYAKKNFK